MTPPVSVSAKVDRAWQRGDEAGLADQRDRLAIMAIVLALFTMWRQIDVRRHAHLLPWAIVASLVALVVIGPMLLLGLGIWGGVHVIGNHLQNESSRPHPEPSRDSIAGTTAVRNHGDYRVISTSRQEHSETRHYEDGIVRIVDVFTGETPSEF